MKAAQPTQKRVTMTDVARAAGCSQAAVSCAIHGRRFVSERLRQHILETIERLHYRPYNQQASTQRKCIGIITSLRPFGKDHMEPIASLLDKYGYTPVFISIPLDTHFGEGSTSEDSLRLLQRLPNLAGILSLHPHLESFDILRFAQKKPITIFNRPCSMLSPYTFDFSSVGRILRKLLRRYGHRKVAFVSYGEYDSTEYRSIVDKGFKKPFLEDSTPVELIDIPLPVHSFTHDILDPQLDNAIANGCTFIFAQSVTLCVMLLKWAKNRRLEIPRNISVAYLDLDDVLEDFKPECTAIAAPTMFLFRKTAETLVNTILDEPSEPVHKTIRPTLVNRDTVIPLSETIPPMIS